MYSIVLLDPIGALLLLPVQHVLRYRTPTGLPYSTTSVDVYLLLLGTETHLLAIHAHQIVHQLQPTLDNAQLVPSLVNLQTLVWLVVLFLGQQEFQQKMDVNALQLRHQIIGT